MTTSFKRYIIPTFAFFIMFAAAKAEGDTVSTWQWQKRYGPNDGQNYFEKVEYSKTDKYIVAQAREEFIFIDPLDGTEMKRIKLRKKVTDEGQYFYGNIKFIHNDTEFLIEREDRKSIDCYSTADLKLRYSLEAPGDEVLSFDVSRDEKRVVAKVGKKGIRIWDLENREITASYTFPTYKNEIKYFIDEPRFEPNGKNIMVGAYSEIKTGIKQLPPYYTSLINQAAIVFNQKLDSIKSFPFSFDNLLSNGIRWSKSGKYLAALSLKKVLVEGPNLLITIIVTVYDADTYKELYSFDAGQSGAIGNFFFTNDEEHIVMAMSSQVDICKVFRIKDGKNTINYHPGNSSSGAFLSNKGSNIIFTTDNYYTNYIFAPTVTGENHNFDNGFISYPNPIRGGGVLKFNQEKPGFTKVFISDEKGSMLKNICNTYFDAGQQAVIIDASDLANGVYLITLANDTQMFTEKIIVNR